MDVVLKFEVTSKTVNVVILYFIKFEVIQRLSNGPHTNQIKLCLHFLSSINKNSSVDTSGLHSTLYNDFSESEQEAVRALASLSNSRNSTPFSPLLSPMLQSPRTAPLFAPCSTSPLPTFSSKPPVDYYKPATQRGKPLMKGDQPVSEQSTDVGGSHAQRLPSAKVTFMYTYSHV